MGDDVHGDWRCFGVVFGVRNAALKAGGEDASAGGLAVEQRRDLDIGGKGVGVERGRDTTSAYEDRVGGIKREGEREPGVGLLFEVEGRGVVGSFSCARHSCRRFVEGSGRETGRDGEGEVEDWRQRTYIPN
jgi:hypothetical protein